MKLLSSRSGIFFLSALTGILLTLSWPSAGFAPLLFISFIPLLLAEEIIGRIAGPKAGRVVFFNSYVAFFLFNLLTTWWVKYASLFGAVAAIICNALFMALVFQLFHFTKTRLGKTAGYLSLVAYWVTFEHLHMNWDLSWPWLILGNGFAGWIKMVQWYEFTGVLGGTIWVLLVNILLTRIIDSLLWTSSPSGDYRKLILLVLVVVLPLGWSFYRYYDYTEAENPVHIGVIQPNIDPYNEKFTGMSSEEQLNRILQLAASIVDSSMDYLVAPETALPDGMWEEQLHAHPHIRRLVDFAERYPHLTWVLGAATNRFYPDSNLRSATARKFTNDNGYYDSYNTALQIEKNGAIQVYHKSKLVPGVEKMPFPSIFKHIDQFAIDLGGISGSLGVQDTPSVFRNSINDVEVAPVICYESVYGDYLSKYVRKGASLIFIITNDGWWSDTPGYRQHLKYATLRAVELRRSIARSANTGISCFINQRGDIMNATGWWEPRAIKATLNSNSTLTFYALHGDYLGKVGFWLSLPLLALAFLARWKKKGAYTAKG